MSKNALENVYADYLIHLQNIQAGFHPNQATQRLIIATLEYIHKNVGDYFNYDYLASETNDDRRKEIRAILFGLLDNSFVQDKESSQFIRFDTVAFHVHWKQQKESALLNVSLKEIHGSPFNLSIKEKALHNQLGSEEWLTDVDLLDLLRAANIRSEVHINHLSTSELGTTLHFIRQKNTGSLSPYKARLLLNVGSNDSGTHWVYAILTINPVEKKISAKLCDSMRLSDQQKQDYSKKLLSAIRYNERTESQNIIKAFPEFEVTTTIEGTDQQHDSWSCGYRALHGLLNDEDAHFSIENDRYYLDTAAPITSAKNSLLHLWNRSASALRTVLRQDTHNAFETLRQLDAADSRTLRDGFYTELLRNVNIPTPTVEATTLSSSHAPQQSKTSKLKRKYKHLDATQLKRQQQIKSLAATLEKQKIIQRDYKTNTVNIDCKKLFSTSDTKEKTLEKVDAVIFSINKPPLYELTINDNSIDELNQALQDRTYYATTLNSLPLPLGTLVQQLGIDVQPDDDFWQAFWEARLNKLMSISESCSDAGELSIYFGPCQTISGSATFNRELANESVDMHNKVALQGLLSLLHDNAERIIGKTLCIQHSKATRKHILLEQRIEEIQLIIDHLNNGFALPIENLVLELCIPDTTHPDAKRLLADFTKKLHELLKVLNEKTAVAEFRLCLQNTDGSNPDLTKIVSNITKLYKRNTINIKPTISSLDHADYIDLLNYYAINRRTINIKNLNKENKETATEEPEDFSDIQNPDEIRLCKRIGDGVKNHLTTSTEIQQEVQQTTQAEQQTSVSGDDDSTDSLNALLKQKHSLDPNTFISRDDWAKPANATHPISFGSKLSMASREFSRVVNFFDGLKPAPTAEKYWDTVFGSAQLTHTIRYLTPAASDELLAHPQYYQFGLSLDNLPPGFALQYNDTEGKQGWVLSYQLSSSSTTTNPLTVKPTKKCTIKSWVGNLHQYQQHTDDLSPENIDTFYNISLGGERFNEHEATFDRLLSFMRSVNPELAEKLISDEAWFFNDIEKCPQHIFGLMSILHEYGCEGIQKIIKPTKEIKKHPSNYEQFFSLVLGLPDVLYSLYVDGGFTHINELANLDAEQQHWFFLVLNKHYSTNESIQLKEFIKAFLYFIENLPQHVSLKNDLHIRGSVNGLVLFDRILYMINKVPASEQQTLLDALGNNNLDLGPEGCYYAMYHEDFCFVNDAMQLNPRAINEESHKKFIQAVFQGDKSDKTYVITYQDLLAMVDHIKDEGFHREHKELLITYFHRFIGREKFRQHPYQNYINFINLAVDDGYYLHEREVIQLLPIIAITTTGLRGQLAADIKPLYRFLHDEDSRLLSEEEALHLGTTRFIDYKIDFLNTIAHHLETLEVKPTLAEITGLIKVLLDRKTLLTQDQLNAFLDIIIENSSANLWQAFATWDSNPRKISPESFIESIEELANHNPDTINYSAQIIASTQRVDGSFPLDNFNQRIDALAAKPHAQPALKKLASIDTQQTEGEHLPTLTEINELLETLSSTPVNQYITTITSTLNKECVYRNMATTSAETKLDFDDNVVEGIAYVNKHLEKLGLQPIDLNQLNGDIDSATLYFEENIAKHLIKVAKSIATEQSKLAHFVTESLIKNEINKHYPQALDLLQQLLLKKIHDYENSHPFLLNFAHEKPNCEGGVDHLVEHFRQLKQYANDLTPLYEIVKNLSAQWGEEKLLTIFNAGNLNRFSTLQLNQLLTALQKIYPRDIPISVINTLWNNNSLNITDSLISTFIEILSLSHLSLKNQVDLLKLVKDETTDLERLTNHINKLRVSHPDLISGVFNLLMKIDAGPFDIATLLDHIELLTSSFESNHPVLSIIINTLSNNPEHFQAILNLTNSLDPKYRANFLTVVGFSYLEHDYVANADLEINLLTKLSELNPNSLTRLAELFSRRPYMRLERLRHFPAFTDDTKNDDEIFFDALDESTEDIFIKSFEVDVPGYRTYGYGGRSPDDIKKLHFDTSSCIKKIKGVKNLSSGIAKPLFSNHAQQLYDSIGNISGLTEHVPLHLAGLEGHDNLRNKPVSALTQDQLKILVKHYRSVIMNEESNPDDFHIAKIEFIAVICEAMYQCTGKYPYETQILAVLNSMLHGGNTISEINTGEGKGIISALMAACKWSEGNPVNVCSANIALAERDLKLFKDFYDFLGIPSNFIKMNSAHEDYQQDGINYSDISSLALFNLRMQLIQKPLPKNISLVADEVDFNLLDTTQTQFRIAANLDEADYSWVYEPIYNFVTRPRFMEHTTVTRAQDIINLRDYLKEIPGHAEELKSITPSMLDRWIDAAYSASVLKEKEDYVIITETDPNDEDSKTSFAAVFDKKSSRKKIGSSFSEGVQQFLHTRLIKEEKAKKKSNPAYVMLNFTVSEEQSCIISCSTKNFANAHCSINGLTGSAGSPEEIKEQASKFSMRVFSYPPHETSRRHDNKPVVAYRTSFFGRHSESAQEAHHKYLYEMAEQLQQAGKPILIIFKTIEDSENFYNYLVDHGITQLQIINDNRTFIEEDAIKAAGTNGMITISTPMFSRGVDIKPEEHGLHVISTYIEDERTHKQIIGRAGRNGQPGRTHWILSEDEFNGQTPKDDKELLQFINASQQKQALQAYKVRHKEECYGDIKNQFQQHHKKLNEIIHQNFNDKKITDYTEFTRDNFRILSEFNTHAEQVKKDVLSRYHNGRLEKDDTIENFEAFLPEILNGLQHHWDKAKRDIISSVRYHDPSFTYDAKEETRDRIYSPVPDSDAPVLSLSHIDPIKTASRKELIYKTRGGDDNDKKVILKEKLVELCKHYHIGPKPSDTSAHIIETLMNVILKNFIEDFIAHDHKRIKQHHTITRTLIDAVVELADDTEKKALSAAIATTLDTLFSKNYNFDTTKIGALTKELKHVQCSLLKRGELPSDSWQDLKVDMDTFKHIRDYALNHLNQYKKLPFLAFDRRKDAKELIEKISNIRDDLSDDYAIMKIQTIIYAVNSTSLVAKKHDYNANKKKSWFFGKYRNGNGSRFQNVLNDIREIATTYGNHTKTPNDLLTKKTVSYIRGSLINLRNMSKLDRYKDLNQTAIFEDLVLRTLINKLNNNNVSESNRLLQMIQARLLQHHGNIIQMANEHDLSHSQSALLQLIKHNLNLITHYNKTTFIVHANKEASLYSDISFSLQSLCRHNYVIEHDDLDLTELNPLVEHIRTTPKTQQLITAALFEMERHIRNHFKNIKLLSIDLVSYEENTLEAVFTVDNETLTLTVHDFEPNNMILMDWPDISREITSPEIQKIEGGMSGLEHNYRRKDQLHASPKHKRTPSPIEAGLFKKPSGTAKDPSKSSTPKAGPA